MVRIARGQAHGNLLVREHVLAIALRLDTVADGGKNLATDLERLFRMRPAGQIRAPPFKVPAEPAIHAFKRFHFGPSAGANMPSARAASTTSPAMGAEAVPPY